MPLNQMSGRCGVSPLERGAGKHAFMGVVEAGERPFPLRNFAVYFPESQKILLNIIKCRKRKLTLPI